MNFKQRSQHWVRSRYVTRSLLRWTLGLNPFNKHCPSGFHRHTFSFKWKAINCHTLRRWSDCEVILYLRNKPALQLVGSSFKKWPEIQHLVQKSESCFSHLHPSFDSESCVPAYFGGRCLYLTAVSELFLTTPTCFTVFRSWSRWVQNL